MNHTLKFYPLGNADCTLIKLLSGKTIIIDYANTKNGDDGDLRCDLPTELNKDVVAEEVDVVAFTHADMDHVKRFTEYFFLEHATKYQSGNRKKIKDLWVPAQVILEEGCEDETRILRAEARFRLKNKQGIKVFSNPSKLKTWLEKEGIALDEVRHLIVNAGESVPGWDNTNSEIEFFAHAPFSYCLDDVEINRNDACLVLQATFTNFHSTKLLLLGDANWELLNEIILLSEKFGNDHRLNWDIVHLSHHCSYLSLAPEKCEAITVPVAPVKRLYEEHGLQKGILISPSCPIPSDYNALQPPHRQAYNYYKSIAMMKEGEVLVTMEFPTKGQPRPVEIVVNQYGATVLKTILPSGFASDRQPPKAG